MNNRLTITVEEAAELLGVSRSLAYNLVRRNELPSLRLGRRVVVPVRALEEMLARGSTIGDADIDLTEHESEAMR
jgi:excisionase family DNA binding protein